MQQENDASYYLRREAAARRLAEAARDPAIRRIHADMADRYAAKARQSNGRPRLKIV